jgi:hypothetical protein
MAREQIEDGNTRDVETLRTNLETLLELAVAPRQSRFDAVASLIEKRVEDLGNALRERARQHDAAHRRLEAETEQGGGPPVGWSAIKQRAGPGLRARIEQHEAALEFSRSKVSPAASVHKQTNRQTDRQTNRQTNTRTNKHTHKHKCLLFRMSLSV